MDKHYLCTGSCGAVVSEEDYNKGLTVCGAPQGCTLKGQPFVKCVHCEGCGQHVPETTVHTCAINEPV